MRGIISTRDLDVESLRAKACALPSMEGQNLVPFVAARKPYVLTADGPRDAQFDADGAYAWQGTGIPLLVYDFGVKWNILRLLAEVGFEPLAVPPSFTPDQARASGAKGVFLSNGPGDPATLKDEIAIIRELVKEFPVTGICLGHQLIGHALGGTTAKLKFGHTAATTRSRIWGRAVSRSRPRTTASMWCWTAWMMWKPPTSTSMTRPWKACATRPCPS